jgi:hypothetical protein
MAITKPLDEQSIDELKDTLSLEITTHWNEIARLSSEVAALLVNLESTILVMEEVFKRTAVVPLSPVRLAPTRVNPNVPTDPA